MSYSPDMKFKLVRKSLKLQIIYLFAVLIMLMIGIFGTLYIIDESKLDPSEISGFTLIQEDKGLKYYEMYHNETKVIYLVFYNGDMIMLRDCNGLPAVYDGGY